MERDHGVGKLIKNVKLSILFFLSLFHIMSVTNCHFEAHRLCVCVCVCVQKTETLSLKMGHTENTNFNFEDGTHRKGQTQLHTYLDVISRGKTLFYEIMKDY